MFAVLINSNEEDENNKICLTIRKKNMKGDLEDVFVPLRRRWFPERISQHIINEQDLFLFLIKMKPLCFCAKLPAASNNIPLIAVTLQSSK